MHEWSPVQVSASTPKRSRTTRSPRATAAFTSGFSRRCRLSMHSDCATSTFGPLSLVVSASRRASRIWPTSKVWVTVFTHSTPTPRTARSIAWPVLRDGFAPFDESKSWPPVAEV